MTEILNFLCERKTRNLTLSTYNISVNFFAEILQYIVSFNEKDLKKKIH